MSQTGEIQGAKPEMQGRMVRTDRYKYCVYEFGKQRESLVDMVHDPLESKNVATQKEYQDVLLNHRKLLMEFGKQHNDGLISELLENEVGPRPFPELNNKH